MLCVQVDAQKTYTALHPDTKDSATQPDLTAAMNTIYDFQDEVNNNRLYNSVLNSFLK